MKSRKYIDDILVIREGNARAHKELYCDRADRMRGQSIIKNNYAKALHVGKEIELKKGGGTCTHMSGKMWTKLSCARLPLGIGKKEEKAPGTRARQN